MLRSIRRNFARVAHGLHRHAKDPAIDVVGVQAIASLTGRVVFYSSIASGLFVMGFVVEGALMVALITFDVVTSMQVLHLLRRLMHYEIAAELNLTPALVA